MTTFKISIGSTLLKALSAGLVVGAIFTTPIEAHESRAIDRHTGQSAGPGVSRDWWPARSALASQPSRQPGGVCDAGDDPMIC